MEQLLERYRQVEQESRRIEDEKNVLRANILVAMQEREESKIEKDYGSFIVAHKVRWLYTPAVNKLEDRLKIAKDKEQKKGLAGREVINYLIYKENNG